MLACSSLGILGMMMSRFSVASGQVDLPIAGSSGFLQLPGTTFRRKDLTNLLRRVWGGA